MPSFRRKNTCLLIRLFFYPQELTAVEARSTWGICSVPKSQMTVFSVQQNPETIAAFLCLDAVNALAATCFRAPEFLDCRTDCGGLNTLYFRPEKPARHFCFEESWRNEDRICESSNPDAVALIQLKKKDDVEQQKEKEKEKTIKWGYCAVRENGKFS